MKTLQGWGGVGHWVFWPQEGREGHWVKVWLYSGLKGGTVFCFENFLNKGDLIS